MRKRNHHGAVHHSFVACVVFCEDCDGCQSSVLKTTKLTKDGSGCPAMDLLLGEQPCEGLFFCASCAFSRPTSNYTPQERQSVSEGRPFHVVAPCVCRRQPRKTRKYTERAGLRHGRVRCHAVA